MLQYCGKCEPYCYTLLRVLAGIMFAMHGSQKLFGWPGDKEAQPLMSLMGVAGIIEFGGGLLIAFGLLTSYAAIITAVLMVAAYFKAHAPQGWLPIVNGGELAVLYFLIFLVIAARGGGCCSLDGLLFKKKEPGM